MCNALSKVFCHRSTLLAGAAISFLMLTACGGGGSSDPAAATSAPLTTGKVALLITDAPTDAFFAYYGIQRSDDH
jgi:hypothetical protein